LFLFFRKESAFFSEEKKQKTFMSWLVQRGGFVASTTYADTTTRSCCAGVRAALCREGAAAV
jgi:hypothetical protein